MDTQQLIALTLVGAAAVYLGRQFVVSARNFFSARSGCSSGCGKCAFAREVARKQTGKTPVRGSVIPLMDVRTTAQNRSTQLPD
jgi:hypothetical protein